jgi:type II restriction enzyme
MVLQMAAHLATPYTSRAQQTRAVTEPWAEQNLFCANCESASIAALPHNTKVIDLRCPSCESTFQLKAKEGRIGKMLNDGAYQTMIDAIREDRTPNLLVMSYSFPEWKVRDLLLVPRFAFPESAIVPRKALSPTARRAGWIGCNIALHLIPPDARIPIVQNGIAVPSLEVRARFRRVKPLEKISPVKRGWTLDVLSAVRSLGRSEFGNDDVYRLEEPLQALHPNNRNVRPKIRQQLQTLRDLGLLIHVEPGRWRLI